MRHMQVKEIENQVFYPWRRFFARMLDLFIYNVLWSTFLAIGFKVNLVSRSDWANILDSFIAVVMMLALEPLLLHLFGTTAGKAIFGLRIETANGGHLSYGQGLERTLGVIASGLGFNIPIYNIVRLWKSYNLCMDKEVQPWDYSNSYTIKDTKGYRTALYIGSHAVLIAILFTIMSAQQNIPPNRGDLTVSEFVENHNYYSENLDIDFGNEYLNEDGQWKKDYDGIGRISMANIPKSDYDFITEDGYVTGISFEVKLENSMGWYMPHNSQMLVASLAFACAQEEIGLFSRAPNRIVDQLNILQDFNFTEAGVTFSHRDSVFSIEK